MPKTSGGVIRWSALDSRNVALATAQLVKEGAGLEDAIKRAQMVLPRELRHKATTIAGGGFLRRMRLALVKHGKLTDAETRAKGPRRPMVRWSPVEWALIARRVAYWRDTLKDARPTARAIYDAAEIELSEDRRRGFASISAHTKAESEVLLKTGIKNAKLIAAIPFDPRHEDPRQPTGTAVFEFTDETKVPKAPAQAPQRPQVAPKPIPAPSTPAQAFTAPQPAAAAEASQGLTFTVTMPPAGVELMRGMIAQAVAKELDLRIPAALGEIAGHLQSSIAQMLTTFLDAKPGETVQAPPRPVAPQAPAAPVVPEIKLPALDVVGLIGPQINQVKDTLNGYASSVRFVDADAVGNWKPRAVVILNTKFISHDAEHKCKKAGVKPIRVHGGADAVLRALNDLFMQQPGATAASMQH